MNYKNKQFKIFEKEYENQFNDKRDEDVENISMKIAANFH